MSLLQTKLINRTDLSNFFQISKSLNDEKLNEIIIKVQIIEILPLLGNSLFEDLMKNTNSTENINLLNGGSYTYNNTTFNNYGLKTIIVHYVDAYYKMFGDNIDTPFGLVNKLNNTESKPVDYNMKKTLYTENKKIAFNLWQNVEKYLLRTGNLLYIKKAEYNMLSFNISKINGSNNRKINQNTQINKPLNTINVINNVNQKSWIDYILAKVSKTNVGTVSDGTVWELTLSNGEKVYRLKPTTDKNLDAIYGTFINSTLSNLIVKRII